MRTKLRDRCFLTEALFRSLSTVRTTVHSRIKESSSQWHHKPKLRIETNNYLNSSPNVETGVVSAKLETLQVFALFSKEDRQHDQSRTLKEAVSNNCQYLFLEKRQNRDKFESTYATKPKIAVPGRKHTITKDAVKIKHQKRVNTPVTSLLQKWYTRGKEENQ